MIIRDKVHITPFVIMSLLVAVFFSGSFSDNLAYAKVDEKQVNAIEQLLNDLISTVENRSNIIAQLQADVIELKIKTTEPYKYNPGQYVSLWKDENLGRSYSLASLPENGGDLIFHIRLIPDGQFSGWVHNDLQVGDTLFVQGPAGDCFYTSGKPEQNLLLIGTGTGLAPLYGIIHDALQQGHTGEIHLFHGALNPSGLYLTEELTNLAQQHSNVKYHPCVMTAEENMSSNITEGDINDIALEIVPKPSGWKSFLCGDEDLVNKLRKQIFLAGSSMNDIYSDPFIPSK